ncbi:MAG: AEC family transporter [Christensenellales bacterium]|jgi:predicted permease
MLFQSVLSTLIDVIVPLSVPVVVGALLVRLMRLETGSLLTLVLYFLTPAMVFTNLFSAELSFEELYNTVFFCLLNLVLLWAVARITSKALKLPSSETAGLTLISTLTNSVNYGLPLVLLAFGQVGMNKAAVFVVIQMLLVNTVGVYFAARSNFSIKNAIKAIFSLPAVYAAILAAALRALGLALPEGLEKGVSMSAQAYSPIMLVVLGAQMASVKDAKLGGGHTSAFWAGMAIRMLASPILAFVTLRLLNIDGLLFPVLFILASMPVAVNAVILAEKFDASPKLVSKCILWSTLASFALLPLLIALVK